MNHWKCTCAVGRLQPLSSNWLWIIQRVSEISGNGRVLLIDMFLVFPFLFSKTCRPFFFFFNGAIVEHACRWGRAAVWKGRCGWGYMRGAGHTASTTEDPTSRAQRQRIFVGAMILGAKTEETKARGSSRLVPVQPRTHEVWKRVGERRVEHWAVTAGRERPAVTRYALLLVPVCKWTRLSVTAGLYINQLLAGRQQAGLVCLHTGPTARLQPECCHTSRVTQHPLPLATFWPLGRRRTACDEIKQHW